MPDGITLLCACDANLVFAAAALWHSVQKRGSGAVDVVCYLSDDVREPDAEALRDYGSKVLGLRVRIVRDRDLPVASRDRLDAMAAGRRDGWRPALARLVLPDVLGPEVSRALYVDVDAVALDDLSEAADVDLAGAPVGAVQAPLAAFQGRVGADPYLNSGVLLIDVPAWRRLEIGARCARWVVDDRGRSAMADQDALNVVLHPQTGVAPWTQLDPSWNVLTPLFLARGPVVYDVPDRVRVLHFAGSSKPWRDADHPFAALYDEHLGAVPFRPPEAAGGLFQ